MKQIIFSAVAITLLIGLISVPPQIWNKIDGKTEFNHYLKIIPDSEIISLPVNSNEEARIYTETVEKLLTQVEGKIYQYIPAGNPNDKNGVIWRLEEIH